MINLQMDESLKPRFVSTPVSERFKMLWNLTRGDVISWSCSTPLVFVAATQEKDILRILLINRAARPERNRTSRPTPGAGATPPNLWRSRVKRATQSIARLSRTPILAAPREIRLMTVGQTQSLATRSIDPGTLNVHEVKVKTQTRPLPGEHDHQFTFGCPPHTAALLEISELKW